MYTLARQLPAFGWNVRVISACGGGSMEALFHEAQIDVAVGPKVSTWGRVETLSFLDKQLTQHPTDLVHTHLGADIWGAATAWWLRLPWVSTIHDTLPEGVWKRRLHGVWLRRALGVAAVSEHVRHTIAQRYGRRRGVECLPSGIEIEKTWKPAVKRSKPMTSLLFVGRLSQEKGLRELLEALALTHGEWSLEVVGDGPERRALEALARERHIDHRIAWHGAQEHPERFYVHADACLVPSQSEGQGLVPLEAASAGVPLLLSDVPALRLAFDAKAAYLPARREPRAWAQAIEAFLRQPHEASARALEAQALVQREYDAHTCAERYAAWYERLLSTV